MASRSTRNAIATLAMAEAVAHSLQTAYRKRERNRTAMGMALRLESSCQAAAGLWPGISQRDSDEIVCRIETTVRAKMSDGHFFPVYTSFALGLIEGLASHLGGEKLEAVMRVHRALTAIHRYFDRTGTKFDCYADATEIVEAWERMGA